MTDAIRVRIEDWEPGLSLDAWTLRYYDVLKKDLEFDMSEERVNWDDPSPELNRIHDQRAAYKVEFESMNEIAIYDQGGDGWGEAAEDASSKIIQGHLLKFSEGFWTYGSNAIPVPEKTQLVAESTRAAWVRWEGGKPVQYIVRNGQWQDRSELGYDDDRSWEAGPDGKARDPWQRTKFVYLMDPNTAEAYTFSTSSFSGQGAVDELAATIHRNRLLSSRRATRPVVELHKAQMKTKFGMKWKPVFKIAGWINRDDPETAPSPAVQPEHVKPDPKQLTAKVKTISNELDDEIPW